MKRRAALCLALGSCLALTAHGFAPPAAWHGAGTGLGVPLRTATAPARQPPVRAGVSRRGTARALPSGGLLSVRCQNDDGATPHKSASVTGKGTRVCIVGGGFGGLYTALQLARLLPLQSEEQRAFYAESAAKQPRAMDQLNIMAAQSAVRNLEGQFLEVAYSEADGGQF